MVGGCDPFYLKLWVNWPPLENARCRKFEQYAAITPKWYETGCQLLLITNRKSHAGFRLIPTSMTLNGAIALIFFNEFDSSAGQLRHSG